MRRAMLPSSTRHRPDGPTARPARVPRRSRGRGAILVGAAALALTCARPNAPRPAAVAPAAAAQPSGGAEAAVAPIGPLPKQPAPIPIVDHPELHPLVVVLRDVSDGFETLVARTAEPSGCPGGDSAGAEVRLQGGRDPRRPWSGWFERMAGGALPGSAPPAAGDGNAGGFLFVRRPLPAPGEQQVAEVHLPVDCGGAVQRLRYTLPDPEPKARDGRALARWAAALRQHISWSTAWSELAGARLAARFPEPPAVAAPNQKKGGKAGAPAAAKRAAKPAVGPLASSRPSVSRPHREASELARLMDTLSGVTSLQETLQSDRWLAAASSEPATVPLAAVKPPALPAHPFAAMLAALGRPVPAEPLAAAAPADFYFLRFRSLDDLFRVRDRVDVGGGPALALFDERFGDGDLGARYESELGLRQGPLTRLLGPQVVEDLAIVGSDPYLREGTDLTLIFRVKSAPAFGAAVAGTLVAVGAAHGGVTTTTTELGGVHVEVSVSADGVVRRHRASAGGFELVSNSAGGLARVLAAIAGTAPRLADEPDFRYMLARDAAVPADVLAFFSDRFVAEVVSPRQKILEARRQIALSELLRPGFAALLYAWVWGALPADPEALVASGLLERRELAHAGGEPIAWKPGQPARSAWGRVGALTPLVDLAPPTKVTTIERDAYALFARTYQDYWRAYADPVAMRVAVPRAPNAPLSFDLRILPIISGTEYAELGRTVGRARVAAGRRVHGARTTLGIGPDAELRKLLSQSLRELPLVGALKVDWLGTWAELGIEDGLRRKRTADAEAVGRLSGLERVLNDLVDLPAFGGVEVSNRAAAAAFLAGARQAVEQAAPGVLDWREAGRERDVPFVTVRAGAGAGAELGDKGAGPLNELALHYSFCKSSLLLSLNEGTLRRRIDECVDGAAPRTTAPAGAEGPQWIVDTDVTERGPLWWLVTARAASELSRDQSMASSRRSGGDAEAVLRSLPGAGAEQVRALARDVFGSAPVTPEGRDYLLAEEGLRDPLRRSRSDPFLELLASEASPYVRLLRALGHLHSEVSFDEEPTSGKPEPQRSLHVRLSLAGH